MVGAYYEWDGCDISILFSLGKVCGSDNKKEVCPTIWGEPNKQSI